MAKKDFTMKFAAPNVKGSKNGEKEGSSVTAAAENDELDKEINQSAGTDSQDESKKVDGNKTEQKEKKGKNLASLLAEAPKSSAEFGENPFLQSKEHFDPASVIKTGYKMRVDYKTVLKLMAELKKGYTIEALLDDALTMFLSSSPEAQKAIQMMRLMK